MSGEFVNWARNQRCVPVARDFPDDEAAVAALVRSARSRGQRVRVVGAGHSWSDAALTSGRLVSLDRLSGVVSIDRERRWVTVRAGMRLRDIIAALAEVGLAFRNLGSIAEQSIAGAMSTGTHGTGLGHGIIPTQVVAMRLVTGTGEVLALGPDRADDLLDAARVSLGALGIITEVTLACRDAFDLEERTWSMPFDEGAAALPELAGRYEHFKAWWLPHTDRLQLFAASPTTAPRVGPGRVGRALDRALNRFAFPLVLGAGRTWPKTIPALSRLVAKTYFGEKRRVDRSDRIFNVAMPPRHLEMEYGLPIEATTAALRAMRDLVQHEGLRVNFIQEARFVAADTCHLSPAYGRASCQLGAYSGTTVDAGAFFARFEQMALAHAGRPHWGKLFTLKAADLAERYPRWDRFQALRAELDPDGVFQNDFTRRVFA